MDLLSYISQAGKRKARFIERARDLAAEHPSVEKLEAEMMERNNRLVDRLKYARIRFSEFERVAADETITSALAAIMIGDGADSKLKDSTFASTLGTLPYLIKFFGEIQKAMKMGRIDYASEDYADSPTKYASRSYRIDDDAIQDAIDMMPTRDIDKTEGSIPATWEGVQERMSRYIVTPAYGWYQTGRAEKERRTGRTEMRRSCRCDKRSCQDCFFYASQGWQPIGALPMPGKRCQCYDRCRCAIDYR